MENYFGLKELYDVSIKTPFPLVIGDKSFETNETILKFDKIQIATLNENKIRKSSNGGKFNEEFIFWENTQEVHFNLSEGVISKIGFALITNSNLFKKEVGTPILVDFSEKLETNENGIIELKYIPIQDNTLFIYNVITGEKIINYTIDGINKRQISFSENFLDIIINYNFEYTNRAEILSVGQRLFSGYLTLTGKMRLKDDFDGLSKTGILEIPRIRLMSDLSIRLGDNVNPMINDFYIVGYPVGEKSSQSVCKIIFLDDDIDSES